MKKTWIYSVLTGLIMLSGLTSSATGQHQEDEKTYRHAIEIFPPVVLAKIYSIQYSYAITPKNHFIVGFTYLNISVENNNGHTIGRFHAPTIPIGYRRYIWKYLHAEYQLWPAYNRYYEMTENRYYDGFDLYNEFRAGYTINFSIHAIPFFVTPQYVFGFGLYPGNKPESFKEVAKDSPVFHAPTLSVGLKF